MDPDFVFIVNYSCPRCHAALEARSSGPPTWLCCASCGRASLPPEPGRIPPPPYYGEDETMMIGQFTTGGPSTAALPVRPRAMAPLPSPEAAKTPMTRLLLGTGFFLTIFLFVFSLLDSNGGRAAFFAFLAVVCLIALTRKPGRAPRD